MIRARFFTITRLDWASVYFRPCLATTVPFRSPIQITLFFHFKVERRRFFSEQKRNGTVVTKQVLRLCPERSTTLTLVITTAPVPAPREVLKLFPRVCTCCLPKFEYQTDTATPQGTSKRNTVEHVSYFIAIFNMELPLPASYYKNV